MDTRPIIFSAPMVNAIIAGRKTQTRRIINRVGNIGLVTEFKRTDTPGYDYCFRDKVQLWHDLRHDDLLERCPYGAPGDRLYVRETCRARELDDGLDGVQYRADKSFVPIENSREAAERWDALYHYGHKEGEDGHLICAGSISDVGKCYGRWVPSIHAPKWTSRITLEITDVRVEQVQEISQRDMIAEGIRLSNAYESQCDDYRHVWYGRVKAFRRLWDSINGKRGFGWDVNPWVWALTFKRV